MFLRLPHRQAGASASNAENAHNTSPVSFESKIKKFEGEDSEDGLMQLCVNTASELEELQTLLARHPEAITKLNKEECAVIFEINDKLLLDSAYKATDVDSVFRQLKEIDDKLYLKVVVVDPDSRIPELPYNTTHLLFGTGLDMQADIALPPNLQKVEVTGDLMLNGYSIYNRYPARSEFTGDSEFTISGDIMGPGSISLLDYRYLASFSCRLIDVGVSVTIDGEENGEFFTYVNIQGEIYGTLYLIGEVVERKTCVVYDMSKNPVFLYHNLNIAGPVYGAVIGYVESQPLPGSPIATD